MACCRVRLSVSEDAYALRACERVQRIGVTESTELRFVDYPTYEGATAFTPSESTQIISTAGSVVLSDITVNPIPSNYGRIERRGAAVIVY